MHGAILNGFISHFIGCIFPGNNSMILSTEIGFQKPVYLNEVLELNIKVIQKVETLKILVLSFKFTSKNQDSKSIGKIKVLLRDE